MKFSQVHQAIVTAYRATDNARFPIVPFIWGPPGVGKSACAEAAARQIAAEVGAAELLWWGDTVPAGTDPNTLFGFFDLRLSQMDAVELGGYPDPDREKQVMTRMIGDFFPHEGRHDLPDRGIILLDEWTSALPSVQAASYQLANDRRLGNKKLKDGWMVMGAGNRMGDGGVVYKQPLPLSNRLAHFDFESDLDGFLSWGARSGEIPVWMNTFLRFRPDLLNTFEEHIKSKATGHAFATERTWHRLAQVLRHTDESTSAVRTWGRALIGEATTVELVAFRQTWLELPDIAQVLADPNSQPVPQESSVRYAVCGALASRVDASTVGAAMAFINRIPNQAAAYETLFVTEVFGRNPDVLTGSPEWPQWANKFCNTMAA